MNARILSAGCLSAVLSLLVAHSALGQISSDVVSVRIVADEVVTGATVTPVEGRYKLFATEDSEPLIEVGPIDSVKIVPAAIGLRVSARELDINVDQVILRGPSDGAVAISVNTDSGDLARRYAGTLRVSRRYSDMALTITNDVDLETYVASVLAREYTLDDIEATRAMAIVARTFAVRTATAGYGEASDGSGSQVYHGIDVITDASRNAAQETAGLILTYNNEPIFATYSASNGGHSASNADVWSGQPLPYLRARRDRFDEKASPYSEWTFRIQASELHSTLGRHTSAVVSEISAGDRSSDGRVRNIRIDTDLGEIEMSGNEFRLLVNRISSSSSLRSTKFDLKRSGDEYVFQGSGYGHGVGLSQWGAQEMANRGYNYEEILNFYYPGTKIEQVHKADMPPAPVLVERADPETDRTPDERTPPLRVRMVETSAGVLGWSGVVAGRPAAPRRRVGW